MTVIDRESTSVYFDATGQGPALLLSHGYSGTSDMWDAQLGPLSEVSRVITWDMRGHARSGSPDDPAAYSEQSAVDDMVAILDACEVERAVIGGLALGGYLSLAFHVAHPERTRALILIGTGPGYRNDEARDAWNSTARRIADDLDASGLAALDDVVWGRHPEHRSATGLAHAARGMLQQDDAHIIDSLPSIAVPTLIVVGGLDEDFLVPASYMAHKIPGAEHVILDGAGHGCNMDAPAEFNRAVLDFLGHLEP